MIVPDVRRRPRWPTPSQRPPGHRHPARAHDDPDAGRRTRRPPRPTCAACAHSSTAPRRSPRPSSSGPPKRLPARRLHPGLRHDRARAVATLLTAADHAVDRLRRSAGRAAPHAEVRIVDADDNEVPRGTVGEIVVRGGARHARLLEQARGDGRGAARRLDAHRRRRLMDDDGYLYIVDRIKDMIISGGENVYSAEVENALAQHPAVAACAVIGVPDDEWGERVHAVVVLSRGAAADRRGAPRARQGPHRRLQGAAHRRVRRRPAGLRRRQDPQARAARRALAGRRPRRLLTPPATSRNHTARTALRARRTARPRSPGRASTPRAR